MSIERTSSSLAGLLEQPAVTANSQSSPDALGSSFQQHMEGAPANAPEQELTGLQKLFRCPQPVAQASTPAMEPASAELELGNSTSGIDSRDPALTSGPLDPSPAAPWPVTTIRPNPMPELAAEAKSAVLAAMQKDGMDVSKVKISYWEELVGYPGGTYTNRTITVQSGSGRKIDLDAALTVKSPWLAASEVKDLDRFET